MLPALFSPPAANARAAIAKMRTVRGELNDGGSWNCGSLAANDNENKTILTRGDALYPQLLTFLFQEAEKALQSMQMFAPF
ncbi:hypothetical protein DdX_09787 [Ditylenchus destructor]|uniref:Uncharacterized protein n=1 Tax=Ditylenchus destructor TaxID=166010 RepID=A0AAD4MZ99_9BILA|nr:hypothetical protein DdX_09787 [Ditylenchus destructor]